jgi:hypothetical protein
VPQPILIGDWRLAKLEKLDRIEAVQSKGREKDLRVRKHAIIVFDEPRAVPRVQQAAVEAWKYRNNIT